MKEGREKCNFSPFGWLLPESKIAEAQAEQDLMVDGPGIWWIVPDFDIPVDSWLIYCCGAAMGSSAVMEDCFIHPALAIHPN